MAILSKDIYGYLSLIFVILSGVPYIYSILKGKTRPHIFTHVIWGLLASIACAAQYAGNAGPGAWAAGLSALFSLATAVLSLSHGERNITRTDWMAFVAGCAAIPAWYLTRDAFVAALIAALVDGIGYYPTIRKSYTKPREEMIFSYVVSNIKHIASIMAMTDYSATTLVYPLVLFGMNGMLIGMLAWRRRALD